jgi:hypothetical protein
MKKYVNACFACHRIKTIKHKSFEQLQSIFMLKELRLKWIINFITDLSFNVSKELAYDSILILVNRYTKYARYIRAKQDWTAVQLIDAMIKRLFIKMQHSRSYYNWSKKSFHLEILICVLLSFETCASL